MPNVNWTRTTGSLTSPIYVTTQGVRQVPFHPSYKPPLGYYIQSMFLGEEYSLGTYGSSVGYVFWGELYPAHVVTTAFAQGQTTVNFTPEGNLAYARAYAKFKEQAYTQAANLTALKERVKTVDMIFQRIKQLHKGAKALKSGRFSEFLSTFGIRPLKKHEGKRWTRPKQFGALWLEYWMGWAPTVGDVYNSIDAYCGKIPDETIRAGSSVPLYNSQTKRNGGSTTASSTLTGKGTVWIQGQVEITNPSLHKAQSLGLLNPVLTVWETTPFSWFFGWFNTLAQTLGQLTDWVGLKLKNTTISAKTEAVVSWHCSDARWVLGWSQPAVMYRSKRFLWFSRHVVATLPVIKPAFRLPNSLSLTRGATLASLLTTMFAPKR